MSMFDSAALQKHVDAALASVPPGHGKASIRYSIDGKLCASVAVRVNDVWTVQGDVKWAIAQKKLEGEIRVEASW